MKLKTKFNRTVAGIALGFMMILFPVASLAGTAYAGNPPSPAPSCPSGTSAKAQVLQGLGATGSDCSDQPVNSLFAVAVNILSLIAGALAVIVVIISAVKYMTSGGDQNKVANAKGTLIYAIVGVAVAGLAQLLIHFVLYQTTNT